MEDRDVLMAEMLRKLSSFIDISIKQFEQEQQFNEKFLSRLEKLEDVRAQTLELNKQVVHRLENIDKKL